MNVEDSTIAVARALERIGVRYYVTGSLASAFYGEPRATNDADLVAELATYHQPALRRELAGRFYLDEADFNEAVKNGRSFNLIDDIQLAKVDIFCPHDAYSAAALSRANRKQLVRGDLTSEVSISSPEDSILSKLRWYRLGNEVSDRQWKDILGVLAAQEGVLDQTYLSRWANELKVADLLENALQMLAAPK
jgi:hypothetical protein